jgi:putative FmdB family regulatory protein
VPLYDYRCKSCQQTTEVRHGSRETFEGPCPSCGGEVARVFNPAGIVFKGSGFYINDSRAASSGSASISSPKSDTPAAAKPAETATAAAPAASSSDSGSKKSDTAA